MIDFGFFLFLGEQGKASLRYLEFIEFLGDSSEDRLAGALICGGSSAFQFGALNGKLDQTD